MTVDQCLDERATCAYFQREENVVTVILAIPISAHQGTRIRSSQAVENSLLQTSRCLDFATDKYRTVNKNREL